jgi:hypothetical protein
VVLLASCASSISPRLHLRRHAFCFLPLAAISSSFQYMLTPIELVKSQI